jgi:telomerase reverse transcriptase
MLFRRQSRTVPKHLLCQGFARAASSARQNDGRQLGLAPGIPGIVCHHPNDHFETVTDPKWCHLLQLLGTHGDDIMLNLLLECGIFALVGAGSGNLYQISGP